MAQTGHYNFGLTTFNQFIDKVIINNYIINSNMYFYTLT